MDPEHLSLCELIAALFIIALIIFFFLITPLL